MEKLQFIFKNRCAGKIPEKPLFTLETARQAKKYHESMPVYKATPLVNLNNLAGMHHIGGIYVKDESQRFGLNAFKGLGGSYCLGRYIADQAGLDPKELTFEKIVSPEVKQKLGKVTFVTATDGNHGRGIAWTAKLLGQKAVVYMPKGSAPERLNNIRALGAEADITDKNYDATVEFAAECEKKYGWVLVQDTAWPGYEVIPKWIMEGYTTMALEAVEQLQNVKPTHIFLQAGVGAMAGAITGFFADYYREEERPLIIIVEPEKANCIYRTALADDGELHRVDGSLDTIMAGLACGVPCTLGWRMLSSYADCFVSVPDYVAANGMRILGNPEGDDPRVISGESGAVTTGLLMELLKNSEYETYRKQLKLDENSRVLCFSTEGDTDKKNYRRIVWEGLYPGAL